MQQYKEYTKMNWETSINNFKKSIPTPKIFIKYHKKLKRNEEFPTILVIPETNFSATFAKVGYLGLKNISENNDINYTGFTIIQA